MFTRSEKESILKVADRVNARYPSTYANLMGVNRLSVLCLLDEPIQSTLHQVTQQKVSPGTKCVYHGCSGILDKRGHCSEDCEQFGINVVDDIMCCHNCNRYGFPCMTCHFRVFHKQLPMAQEDY